MSMEHMGGSREMRGSKARASEALWRESAVPGSQLERHREVQEKLSVLEGKLERNIDTAIQTPGLTPEERQRDLEEGRKINRRIQELREEKEKLEQAIRKSGGTAGDPIVQ